jgi:4-amino-4-deoxy-L-arabinose transferase-like glycosyltransferase
MFAQQAIGSTIKRSIHECHSGLPAFIGLAVLTKGPAALLIFGLTIVVCYLLLARFKLTLFVSVMLLHLYTCSITFVGGFWFLLHDSCMATTIRWWILWSTRFGLFKTEDAGHGGFPLYHFVVLFFWCFSGYRFCTSCLTKKERALMTRSGSISSGWLCWYLILGGTHLVFHCKNENCTLLIVVLLSYVFPGGLLRYFMVSRNQKRKLPLWLAGFQIVYCGCVFSGHYLVLPTYL